MERAGAHERLEEMRALIDTRESERAEVERRVEDLVARAEEAIQQGAVEAAREALRAAASVAGDHPMVTALEEEVQALVERGQASGDAGEGPDRVLELPCFAGALRWMPGGLPEVVGDVSPRGVGATWKLAATQSAALR